MSLCQAWTRAALIKKPPRVEMRAPSDFSHQRQKRPLLYCCGFSLGTHVARASPNSGIPSSCLSQTCTTHSSCPQSRHFLSSCPPMPAPTEGGTLHSGTTIPLVPTSYWCPSPGRSRRLLMRSACFLSLSELSGQGCRMLLCLGDPQDHWLWAQGEALSEKERGKADRVLWVCLLLLGRKSKT